MNIPQKVVVSKYLSRHMGTSVVKVLVGDGEKQKPFFVDKGLITSRSEFLARALNGAWKEAEEGLVKLPEDDPVTFGLYMELLYTGTLPLRKTIRPIPPGPLSPHTENKVKKSSADRGTPERSFMASEREYLAIAKVYVLCEKLQDSGAKNSLIDAMIETRNEVREDGTIMLPTGFTVKVIYEGTIASSPMRQWLVDIYSQSATKSWFKNFESTGFPADFLFDLIMATTDHWRVPRSTFKLLPKDYYHEGKEGKQYKQELQDFKRVG